MKRKKIFFFVLSLAFAGQLAAQLVPAVSSGTIKRIANFQSRYVSPRNVDVWLPPGYDPKRKYSVVYMHDGQMLFDSANAWNKKEWKVDEVVSGLIAAQKTEPCIVVGIWNTPARMAEYFPDKIFNLLDEKTQAFIAGKFFKGQSPVGDKYLRFIVSELKPFIDQNYSIRRGKSHTMIMGSSMGGLISLYAISEYSDVFGGAACMSTAWLSQIEPHYEVPLAVFRYLKENMPTAWEHKLYMDYGTGESDKIYELTQSFVDAIAADKGFAAHNYMSQVFENARHDEDAWSGRLNVPFEFLLPKTEPQKTMEGKIDFIGDFHSQYIEPLNVEVWLPDDYTPKKKYAVLYMHDGQMLFDAATTWNGQSWDADDVATALMSGKKVRDFIIVGIWNGGESRLANYFPQKPFEDLSDADKKFISGHYQPKGQDAKSFRPDSDNYLKFIVKELKPFIDKKYSVYRDKNNTFVMGSSMGGLISMYAICEYPNVFGGAACLSTHWPGIFVAENNPVPGAFVRYLESKLPDPKNHRIYFDYGTETLDAMYEPFQKQVDQVMMEKGFSSSNWNTMKFEGDDHSEESWNKRLHIPLEFLLR